MVLLGERLQNKTIGFVDSNVYNYYTLQILMCGSDGSIVYTGFRVGIIFFNVCVKNGPRTKPVTPFKDAQSSLIMCLSLERVLLIVRVFVCLFE